MYEPNVMRWKNDTIWQFACLFASVFPIFALCCVCLVNNVRINIHDFIVTSYFSFSSFKLEQMAPKDVNWEKWKECLNLIYFFVWFSIFRPFCVCIKVQSIIYFLQFSIFCCPRVVSRRVRFWWYFNQFFMWFHLIRRRPYQKELKERTFWYII